MSNEKFTPGEWCADIGGKFTDTSKGEVTYCGNNNPEITINGVTAKVSTFEAAPDMYRALREIVNAVARCESSDDLSLIDEFTEDMEHNARAALAKAEGK